MLGDRKTLLWSLPECCVVVVTVDCVEVMVGVTSDVVVCGDDVAEV
ncbi:unnamed protein product, partial [Adineta steineri]